VFSEYSNLHKGEFKSKVKYRILYSHATEVLRMMAVTWKGGCEAYVLSITHLNEPKITDKRNHKTKKPSVELSCVVDYDEKIGTRDRSTIVVGFLAKKVMHCFQ
jgi:hypothetical protein